MLAFMACFRLLGLAILEIGSKLKWEQKRGRNETKMTSAISSTPLKTKSHCGEIMFCCIDFSTGPLLDLRKSQCEDHLEIPATIM